MADSKQAPKQSWQIVEDGLTVVQIADLTGFGASSIRQWSTKFDIPFAIDGKRNVYLADGQQMFVRILDMKSQGMNESEIARELIKSGHVIRDSVTRDSDDPVAGQGLEALLEETITRALALQAEQVGKQLEQQTKLAEWLRWEGALRLFINRDEWNAPKLAADSYHGKYLGKLKADLAEATVNLDEFLRWEHELDLSYPNDARGNRTLTRDWKRYLQTVQEKYAEGWTVERVVYNIKTPNEVRPQLAYAGAGPEY